MTAFGVSSNVSTLPPGSFLFRVADRDHLWLSGDEREAGHPLILLSRHLAPFPAGDRRRNGTQDCGVLRNDAIAHARTFLVDCDTPILAKLPSRAVGAHRAAEMACAQVFDLPIGPTSFATRENVRAFTRAAVEGQRGSWATIAPYFQFSSPNDKWLAINLELLEETIRIAGGTDGVLAVIQMPVAAIEAGAAAIVGRRYADAGAGLCLLRVAGFDAETADLAAIGAYLRTSRALQQAGLRVIADCVGRFGPALVADGAVACSSGLRAYRSVPVEPFVDGREEFTSAKAEYEASDDWYGVAHDQVTTLRHLGRLAPCPVAECDARVAGESKARGRCQAHMIHTLARRATWAHAVGAGAVAANLQGSANPVARRWGQALDAAASSSALA